MKQTTSLILLLFLTTAGWTITPAQTLGLAAGNAKPVPQVVVTFNLPSPASRYTTFQDEGNKERFYIAFPTSSVPSYQTLPAGSIKVMVDNEKSDHDSIVFWVPVLSGTSPRVDFNQSTLTLTFSPSASSAMVAVGETVGKPTESTAKPASIVMDTANGNAAAPPAPAPAAAPAPKPPIELAEKDKAESQNLALANVDLAVPESPAFTVLGLTPDTVVRPSSPRQFATALLSGVDRNGNFQSGTAIDTVPYLLLAGKQLTLGQYQTSYKLRLASRTQFSFATTKGASEEDKSVRLSLGLRMTLWDSGDPRFDTELNKCFDRAAVAYLEGVRPPDVLPPDQLVVVRPNLTEKEKMESVRAWAEYEVQKAEANPKRLQAGEKCRAESRKRNWNKSSWIIAYAPSWISPAGETKNFQWNGGGFWSSVAYGFEGLPGLQEHSQIIFHGRYRNNEQVPDPINKGAFIGQDSLFLGTRLRVGNENATGSFEGVFVRSRPEGKVFDNSARYSVGLERRIAENLWFALSFGGETGRADGRNKGFVLTSFRWGFSEKPTIPQLPGKP
jgi:hypothetical protein